MPNTRRWFTRVAGGGALLLASALISGCGSDDNAAGGDGRAPEKLVISTSGNYLTSFAPLWAADFDAIEDEFGTEVVFEPFNKGSDAMTALLGGSAQICNCGAPTGLAAAGGGKDVNFIGDVFMATGQVVVASKELESSHGEDIASFGDATWGYTSPGSGSQLAGQGVAEHAGLVWDDLEQLALGSTTAYAPALANGRVDIVVMDVPTAVKTIEDGVGYLVMDLVDPAKAAPIIGDIIGAGLVTTTQFQDDYPELTQAVVTSLVEGLRKIEEAGEDPQAAYDLMSEDFQEANPDPDRFAKEWPYIRPSFLIDGRVSDQAISDTIDFAGFAEADLATPEAENYFDNSYVDTAHEELEETS